MTPLPTDSSIILKNDEIRIVGQSGSVADGARNYGCQLFTALPLNLCVRNRDTTPISRVAVFIRSG
jgi:hypothetical protein